MCDWLMIVFVIRGSDEKIFVGNSMLFIKSANSPAAGHLVYLVWIKTSKRKYELMILNKYRRPALLRIRAGLKSVIRNQIQCTRENVEK